MCALNATEVFSGHEDLSDELHRLVNEVNDQLKAGNKTICLESDFDTLSDEDIQKLSLLDKIDLDFDLVGLLDEDKINELGEVLNDIVSDNSGGNQADGSSAATNKEGDNTKINNKAVFPPSKKDLRYGIIAMIRDKKYYRFVVTIDGNGSITGGVDSMIEAQRSDDYIDRSDKWYAEQLNYLIDHLDDPKVRIHTPEVLCTKEMAIHYLRGNVFKTREEFIEHAEKYNNID